MSNINLGVSLYSYTKEYAEGTFDFEGCVKQAAEAGAIGYEVVASQMIPSYPYISDEFLNKTIQLKEKYGISPISYGANMDRGMLRDRDLTEDEMLQRAIIDVKSANKLGCKYMREQFLLSPNGLKRLAPYAELYDVKVGIEIHNPETPSTPIIKEYIKAIKESGSSHIGLVPDFGCFAVKPNKPNWDEALKNGAQPELLEMATQLRYNGLSLDEARVKLEEAGANDAVMGAFFNMYGFVTFYNEPDLKGLEEIMPYCIYFHGKFHHIDENNQEASIPYPEILEVIHKSGYKGFIMSEYEDHTGKAIEMTKRHVKMEREILDKL